MIINNARGSHSSPGVYTKEVDVTYSTKSLGITTLGVAGETLKGPAFEPIRIEKWDDFVDYFGGTSTEKYKGSQYPKYELPYIAKEYLKESRQLEVCRVLGLSGYDAGPAWVVKANITSGTETTSYVLAVLRSKGYYDGASDAQGCEKGDDDKLKFYVSSVKIDKYVETVYDGNCNSISSVTSDTWSSIGHVSVGDDVIKNLGKFTLEVTLNTSGTDTEETPTKFYYPVSLNYGDGDYIYNVLGTDPLGSSYLFVEEFYDYALNSLVESTTGVIGTITTGDAEKIETLNNYKDHFQCAVTPWIVSELHTSGNKANVTRLFKFYTISDGDASNKQVKISITNIKPDEGTFDVLVRNFNDSDASPLILEKYSRCSLVPGTSNYIALKIGTIDGEWDIKSKYVALEMNNDIDISNCVPAGFLGYPLHKFGNAKNLPLAYNTEFNTKIKPKRQYFGLSSLVGIDEDVLKYKGNESGIELSKGFHLDALLSSEMTGDTSLSGKASYDIAGGTQEAEFEAVSPYNSVTTKRVPRILTERYMADTIYADINLRKFTVYPYGGFDGWDIYRESRTNTNPFKASQYKYEIDTIETGYTHTFSNRIPGYLNLPVDAFTSDYYAYLGAYNQFANKEEVDINLFATPGIDFVNNSLLVEDALDMIEDSDDGRGGDSLYIVTAPNKPYGRGEAQEDMYTAKEIVDERENAGINSSYIATYWPWVRYYDGAEKRYVNLPPTKDVVRDMAYTDRVAYPWFAPAGINRGDVNCTRASMKTKLGDEDTLYDGLINPVKTFAEDGVKIWGNKTMYDVDSPLNRVNVRRLMNRVKKLVSSVGKTLVFDPQDDTVKDQFDEPVRRILSEVKQNRGIYDYRIKYLDSPEARDQHTLAASIGIKPTPALEYIDLTFTVYPESVEFQED